MSPKEISRSIVRQLGRPIVGHLVPIHTHHIHYNTHTHAHTYRYYVYDNLRFLQCRLMNPKCACASWRRWRRLCGTRERSQKSLSAVRHTLVFTPILCTITIGVRIINNNKRSRIITAIVVRVFFCYNDR